MRRLRQGIAAILEGNPMRLAVGTELVAQALLFDMDGTLIDSRLMVEVVWRQWCEAHDVDFDSVLPQLHGVRLADSVRQFTPPGYDVEQEIRTLYDIELHTTDGIVPIRGALDLLASLPADRWTIVTSADQELARTRLAVTGIVPPPKMVGGDDVKEGKPHPAGYLEGARRMGVSAAQTLVFEDAIAGIRAGQAAGARVIAIASGHPGEIPDGVEWIPDMSVLRFVEESADGVRLRVVA
jgi:sugar-phosphatase